MTRLVGGEETGSRSAILYTVIESAKHHGHEPHAYLKDILERLPSTRTTGLDGLLPENWQPHGEASTPLLATAARLEGCDHEKLVPTGIMLDCSSHLKFLA